jgi:hypothetical protein
VNTRHYQLGDAERRTPVTAMTAGGAGATRKFLKIQIEIQELLPLRKKY